MSQDAIFGRDEELVAISRFFDNDNSGPRALLLEGEAGIGKTTLWREAVRLAQSRSLVLSSRASAPESKLSFTVLGDLLTSVLDTALEELPAAQRNPLEAALLLGPAVQTRPDARAVSLAVLGVLRALLSDAPVSIAIDDVQWADAPSARALSFALRRLVDEPVTVVAAMRSGSGTPDPLDLVASRGTGVNRLAIGPIAPVPLGRLLRQGLGRSSSPPLVRRIHKASGGNPFFALEIARALTGQDALLNPGEPLPVPANLLELLRRRIGALPRSACDALLAVAASAQPTVPLVEAVVAGGSGAMVEAENAGIVEVLGSAIEFTHPLLASALYESASSQARRATHAALAKVVKEPEERARHLALSATGPSEEVARSLETAADRSVARGAPLAAAELYRMSAEITPLEEPGGLHLRRLRSAQTLFAAGDTRGARELSELTLSEAMPGQARAQTMYSVSFMSWNDLRRVKPLLVQALEEAGEDAYLRALILGDMAWVEFLGCNPTLAIPLAHKAIEMADEVDDPFPLRNALAAQAMAKAVLGHEPTDLLIRGISEEGTLAYGEVATPRTCLARLRMWEGAVDVAHDILSIELDRYLEQGHESASWEVRAYLAEVEYRAGRWEQAARFAREAHEIVVEADWTDMFGEVAAVKALIGAGIGDERQARVDGTEALSVCQRTGDRWNEIRARAALGFLDLSLGDAAAAHRWLAPAAEIVERMDSWEPGAFPFVPDEVEALVALRHFESAARLTDRLGEQGRALDRPLAIATAARCSGLLAAAGGDLDEAEEHLERSLGEHARTQQPFELGRTLLVAGALRRRKRLKSGARDLLEQAATIFDDLGASLWSEQARRELERIGGRAPTPTELTPTEAQMAHLVAEGKTNREVATALFVSVHTVEANLKRIYRKLDVRSRTELARRL